VIDQIAENLRSLMRCPRRNVQCVAMELVIAIVTATTAAIEQAQAGG
jgi:hypothetical protein